MCLRECEYLDYIKSRDAPFYSDVMTLLEMKPTEDGVEPSAPHPTLPKSNNDIYPDLPKKTLEE